MGKLFALKKSVPSIGFLTSARINRCTTLSPGKRREMDLLPKVFMDDPLAARSAEERLPLLCAQGMPGRPKHQPHCPKERSAFGGSRTQIMRLLERKQTRGRRFLVELKMRWCRELLTTPGGGVSRSGRRRLLLLRRFGPEDTTHATRVRLQASISLFTPASVVEGQIVRFPPRSRRSRGRSASTGDSGH